MFTNFSYTWPIPETEWATKTCMYLDRALPRVHSIGEIAESPAYQGSNCWSLKPSKMATPSHNAFPRSPNPSTRSYDSSSVSSATSPRPQAQYLNNLMNTGARAGTAHQSQPIGAIPSLPSVSQSAFQSYTPVAATPVMGRESLPSNDSVAKAPS